MPMGPQGQWRLANGIACVVYVGPVTTGEIQETYEAPRRKNPVAESRRASQGGKARAETLTAERRRENVAAGAGARRGA